MVCPLVGGYQPAVQPVPPLGELLVVNLLGEQEEVEEVGKVVVSATLMGTRTVVEVFCVAGVIRPSRSTQEEEEV